MITIVQVRPDSPDALAIAAAGELIRRGQVVAYPTDTLYGLAVDPRNPEAVRRLYALKGRAESSALSMIAADVAQVREAAEMSADAVRLALRWWPGPLTIVLHAKGNLAPNALAGGTTVGVRVPSHPVATALARAVGFAITATSANRSGEPAAVSADEVARALPELDAIVDAGAVRGGAPSTLVDASRAPVRLLRDGAIAWSKVLESLQ